VDITGHYFFIEGGSLLFSSFDEQGALRCFIERIIGKGIFPDKDLPVPESCSRHFPYPLEVFEKGMHSPVQFGGHVET
jgi:hypothetical protein